MPGPGFINGKPWFKGGKPVFGSGRGCGGDSVICQSLELDYGIVAIDTGFTARFFITLELPAGCSLVSVAWSFGDGASVTNSSLIQLHDYPNASNSYVACATVTIDCDGIETECEKCVSVGVHAPAGCALNTLHADNITVSISGVGGLTLFNAVTSFPGCDDPVTNICDSAGGTTLHDFLGLSNIGNTTNANYEDADIGTTCPVLGTTRQWQSTVKIVCGQPIVANIPLSSFVEVRRSTIAVNSSGGFTTSGISYISDFFPMDKDWRNFSIPLHRFGEFGCESEGQCFATGTST